MSTSPTFQQLRAALPAPEAPLQAPDKWRDMLGLVALCGAAVAVLPVVPDWPQRHLAEPAYAATAAYVVTVLGLLALRAWRGRGNWLERVWLASFLAVMPIIYLANLLLYGADGKWLSIELAGVGLYGALAWLGLVRSVWFLALGILAHGVLWDVWHHSLAFTPDWYATGCMIADVGTALYVATQASAHERHAEAH
jgi:hypothetical protein